MQEKHTERYELLLQIYNGRHYLHSEPLDFYIQDALDEGDARTREEAIELLIKKIPQHPYDLNTDDFHNAFYARKKVKLCVEELNTERYKDFLELYGLHKELHRKPPEYYIQEALNGWDVHNTAEAIELNIWLLQPDSPKERVN